MATTDGILNSILATIPAASPPDGVTPNFGSDAQNNGYSFVVVGGIMVPISAYNRSFFLPFFTLKQVLARTPAATSFPKPSTLSNPSKLGKS